MRCPAERTFFWRCARTLLTLLVSTIALHGQRIYDFDSSITLPKPVYHPSPSSPIGSQVAGNVVLRLVISADGVVHDTKVMQPLNPTLDRIAEETVRQWKFEPAVKDGKPVWVRVEVTLNFGSLAIAPFGGPLRIRTAAAAEHSDYLLTVYTTKAGSYDNGVDYRCATIDAAGHYRWERKFIRFPSRKSELKIVEGSVSEDQLVKLKEILGSERLKTAKHDSGLEGTAKFFQGHFVNVFIPRAEGLQRLSYATYFGPTGSLSNHDNVDSEGAELLDPIMKWLKRSVESQKVDALRDASPECPVIAMEHELHP